MRLRKKITRRVITGQLGALAGITLVNPAMAGSMLITPPQVKGPFYPIEDQADKDLDLTLIKGHTEAATGEQLLVRGRVYSADGKPLANALVDIWQANHHGRYSHAKDPNTAPLDEHFQGWGIVRTDADGYYSFKTVKPGPYSLSFLGGDGWRCRHIHFKVTHDSQPELITQMYFDGDPLIAQDLEIAKAPESKRHLLIAKSVHDDASGLPLYTFDVVLG
jgi:protocatechuate 3,4-dioxygenase, beta subunit